MIEATSCQELLSTASHPHVIQAAGAVDSVAAVPRQVKDVAGWVGNDELVGHIALQARLGVLSAMPCKISSSIRLYLTRGSTCLLACDWCAACKQGPWGSSLPVLLDDDQFFLTRAREFNHLHPATSEYVRGHLC